MNKLFSTPLDKLYSIVTILVLLMIIFPPVATDSSFRGYEFVFDLSRREFIDLGRLSLQFIALGAVFISIKRIIQKR